MSNFFGPQEDAPQNETFGNTPNAVPIDDQEMDVIHKTNNPNVDTPFSFGLVETPVEVLKGLALNAPDVLRIAGQYVKWEGDFFQPPENKDKTTGDVFTKSLVEHAFPKTPDGKMPNVIEQFGGLLSAEKDAVLSMFSDGTTPNVLQNEGNKMIESAKQWQESMGLIPKGGSNVAFDVGRGLGQFAIQIGSYAATKSPALGARYMGVVMGTDAYTECIKSGQGVDACTVIGAADSKVQMMLEGTGTAIFANALKGSGAFKKTVFRIAEQAGEESTQQIADEAIMGVSGVRNTPLDEKAWNVLYAGAVGAIASAPISVIYTQMEKAGKEVGMSPEETRRIADKLIESKDVIVDAATVLVSKETAGVTNDEPARAETLKAVKQVIAQQQEIEKATADGSTDSPMIAAQILLKSPKVSDEVKANIQGLGTNFTMEQLQQAAAGRANEAIAPIMAQQDKVQQEKVAAIQAETDDISLNLLREVTAIQESKSEIDPETQSMLEQTADILKERRKIKKPVGLAAFVKSLGGVKEYSGELQNIGIGKRNGIRNENGMFLDDAGEAAWKAGYFDERPTVEEFISALADDFNGKQVLSSEDWGAQENLNQMNDMLGNLNQALDEKGVSYNRENLEALRRRVRENIKLDKAAGKATKVREMQMHRLAAEKRAVENSPPRILADKLKTFIQGMRKGGVLQKQETKAVQENLIGMIEESGLEANDRAKFIRTIKNTQTIEQLEAKLPEIVKSVEGLLEASKRRGIINKIKNTLARVKDSNVVAVDFVKQIESLVNEIDTSKRTEATKEKLQKTLDYMEKNPNAAIPNRILNKLEILNKKPLGDVTTQELEAIAGEIDKLLAQGKTKLALMQKQKERLKEKRIKELQENSVPLNNKEFKKADIGERLSFMDNIKNRFIGLANRAARGKALTSPMDVFFDLLDGVKNYKGANHRIFKQTADVAFSRYLNLKESATREVKNLTDKLELDEKNFEKIGAWAVLQQEGGRKKLLDTGITEQEIDGLRLNEKETQMYQLMRRKLDEMLPAIQETMRTVYNKDVAAVSDYFPFMTDHEAMGDFEIQDQLGPNVPSIGKKKNVEKGFTISRTLGSQKIRIDALNVFLKHVDNAAYLIEMGGDIKALGDVATSKEYGAAVGDIGQEMTVEWINLLARKGSLPGRIAVLDTLRRNVGFAVLGFKLSSVMIQPTALADASSLVGGGYVMAAVPKVADAKWRKFLWDNMPEIRERAGDDQAYLDMGGNSIVANVREAGFWALKNVDALAASATAIGAYTKSVEQRGGTVDLSKPDRIAIQEAQLMMRRTQSSAFAKDTPGLLTQGKFSGNVSLDKLIFQFQSFMLNRWSLIKHDMWRAGVKQGNTKQALNIATWMILAFAAEVGIRRLSKEIIAAMVGDDLEPWEDTITQESVKTALGTVPFVSQATSAFTYGSVPVPSIGMMVQVGERLKWAEQSKSPEKKAQHYAEAAILIGGTAAGIPGTLQTEQIVRGALKKKNGGKAKKGKKKKGAIRD